MNLFHLKPALLLLFFFWQTALQPSAPFSHFRFNRAVTLLSAAPSGQACAILDADVFAHAAPALKDLRLYRGRSEVPYSTSVSDPPQQDTDDARILNLRAGDRAHTGRRIVFDLEMPLRPYTSVVLDLAPSDFIATAIVSGSSNPGGRNATPLGSFTLFDLSSQHLSRSTTIPLSESTYPYLHLELALVPAPGSASFAASHSASLNAVAIVRSAAVPPSREAQTLYTTTQQPKPLIRTGRDSIAIFKVAARVPIERIAFALPTDYKGDFSREVKIDARGIAGEDSGESSGLGDEEANGTILHIHKSEAGHDLSAETLTIPVAIGSNMQQPASVEIHVENSSDAPPPLSVRLQMRQRRICFETVSANAPLTLYYGDPSLDAPAYADASLNQAAGSPRIAQLGPETQNPVFVISSPSGKFARHRPILRWVALLCCMCLFALLFIRSVKTRMSRR